MQKSDIQHPHTLAEGRGTQMAQRLYFMRTAGPKSMYCCVYFDLGVTTQETLPTPLDEPRSSQTQQFSIPQSLTLPEPT